MTLLVLVISIFASITAVDELGQEATLVNSIYFAWFPVAMMSPIGLPVLVSLTALITWLRTRELSMAMNPGDAKRRMMISAWVSTTIATLPILLLSLSMLVLSLTTPPTNPGDGAGLGMAIFFSMLCVFWNVILIITIGLLARLLIKNEKPDQNFVSL